MNKETQRYLMIPRYKVINDWLGNKYMPVGTIYTLCDEHETSCTGEYPTVIIVPNDIDENDFKLPFMVNEKEFQQYPHLFQPLPWYAEREEKDLPEYIKCIKTPDQKIMPNEVLKVKWVNRDGKDEFGRWIFLYTGCFIPATLEEYQTFKQLKP